MTYSKCLPCCWRGAENKKKVAAHGKAYARMMQEIDIVELIHSMRINRFVAEVVLGDQKKLIPYFK